jgi:hypothetical protein
MNSSTVWAIAAFFAGSIFSAGMGWGRGSGDVANAIQQIGEVKGMIALLSEKFTVSDKTITADVGKIQEHLSYDDSRLDKLEAELDSAKRR